MSPQDLENLLKRRAPRLWSRVEGLFTAGHLRAARRRCRARDPAEGALFAGVRQFLLFVGQPRSGHSALGALLNAHPAMLVSHNLDVLSYLQAGFSRDELFHLILERERWLAARGRQIGGWSYAVPGLAQGRHDNLVVVGDKRAGHTSRQLGQHPELLSRLADALGLPVLVIQYVRDPWDNISSIWLREDIRRGRSLEEIADWYFGMFTAATAAARSADPRLRFVQIHHEDLLRDPGGVLVPLLGMLDVSAGDDYLRACRAFLHPAPRSSRAAAPWTPALVASVAARAAGFAALARYGRG